MLPGLVICTHSTLDMPVALRGIHENMLITKQPCNRLSLSLGVSKFAAFAVEYGYCSTSSVADV